MHLANVNKCVALSTKQTPKQTSHKHEHLQVLGTARLDWKYSVWFDKWVEHSGDRT